MDRIQPRFLTGEYVYLRPMVAADKEQAMAWWPAPFPVSVARAEAYLREVHEPGWHGLNIRFAIVRAVNDAIIGSAVIDTSDQRAGWLTLHMAPSLPDADARQADALSLLIPWLRDEWAMMAMTVPIAADEVATLAIAERLGMVLGVRLRQHVARGGQRVDKLLYQALGRDWRLPDA